MPVNQQHDITLDSKGYMLSRATGLRGRAWRRSGQTDAPEQRLPNAAEYGRLPGEIDHVEVWNDWSGGFGDAYRDPQNPNRYHWSENFDARFPRQLIHAQEMKLFGADFANFFIDTPAVGAQPAGRGQIILARKDKISQIVPYLAGVAPIHTFGGATGRSLGYRPAVFGSFVYIPDLNGSEFVVTSYATAIKNDASWNMPARIFINAGNRLWRVHGAGQNRGTYIQSVTVASPTGTANWSATLNVGNNAYNASDGIALDDQVYLGMPDGLYAGDQSGTFVNVLPDVASQRHEDNGRHLSVFGNGILYPHQGGLFHYRPTSEGAIAREVGPPLTVNSPVVGRIRTTFPFGGWVYAGLFNGSQSYVLAGRDAGPGVPYAWHVQQRITGANMISRLHVDSITVASNNQDPIPQRMWAAMDHSLPPGTTAETYWTEIPPGNGNPLVPVSYFTPDYNGSARMDLPSVDWGAPGTPKVYRAAEVWADNLGTMRWGNVYYTVDDGARVLLGTVNTSPKQTIYFSSGEGSFVSGQAIALSLESFIASGHTATTPVYRSIILRGALRPRVAELITAVVDIADGKRDRRGGVMRPGHVQIGELRTLAEQASPVQLVDLAGATSWVEVLGPVEEQEVFQNADDNPTVAATIRMAVLVFSGGV